MSEILGTSVSTSAISRTIPLATFEVETNAVTGVQQLSDPDGTNIPVEPINPVSGLVVSDNQITQQTISWSYSYSNHTGFDVEYVASGGGAWIPTGSHGASSRSHTQTGLPSSTLVRYRVRAKDATSTSTWQEVEQTTQSQPSGGTNLEALFYYENFEGKSVGATIESTTALRNAENGRISNTQVMNGSRSMSTYCALGDEGWDRWGFTYNPADEPLQGAEMWVRFQLWYPSGWYFDTTANNQKCMRFGFADSPGGNITRWRDNGLNEGDYRIQSTNHNDGWNYWKKGITPGRWCTFESYLYLHVTNGKQRIWIDGEPVELVAGGVEYNGTILKSSGQNFETLYWHTYWNQGSDDDRLHYIDNVVIAVDGPTTGATRYDRANLSLDSNGHPFIGV